MISGERSLPRGYLTLAQLLDENGVVLDYDKAGALVGIDVQHASERADIHSLAVSKMPLDELSAA